MRISYHAVIDATLLQRSTSLRLITHYKEQQLLPPRRTCYLRSRAIQQAFKATMQVANMRPCFYRAPTDNDRGGSKGTSHAARCVCVCCRLPL